MIDNDEMRPPAVTFQSPSTSNVSGSSSSSSTSLFASSDQTNPFKSFKTANATASQLSKPFSPQDAPAKESSPVFELSKPFSSFHTAKIGSISSLNALFSNSGKKTSASNQNVQNSGGESPLFTFTQPAVNSQVKLKPSGDSTPNLPNQRNHVVLVEQSPFSVFKSVKSQENNETVRLFIHLPKFNFGYFLNHEFLITFSNISFRLKKM
jgi:hypothetical protein